MIAAAFSYDSRILVEQGVMGREIECAVLGNDQPQASIVSMYPKLWEASGIEFSELCDRLITLALEKARGMNQSCSF